MASDYRLQFTVEIYPDVFRKTIDRRGSLASQHIEGAVRRLRDTARGFIGTEYSGTTGKPKEPRSGSLKNSGKVLPGPGAGWLVAFEHPIANIHHNGAKSHSIGGKGQKLGNKNFPNTRANHPKYPDRLFAAHGPVHHPGHGANPFLLKAADQMGLRRSGSLLRGPLFTNPILRFVSSS